jgi:hypothetical protein
MKSLEAIFMLVGSHFDAQQAAPITILAVARPRPRLAPLRYCAIGRRQAT